MATHWGSSRCCTEASNGNALRPGSFISLTARLVSWN
uniref:Uncharacterized protein n=1 Tax=Arundo donax TaxID=35708 RepID=A0A0A8ZRJ6_ARUDO